MMKTVISMHIMIFMTNYYPEYHPTKWSFPLSIFRLNSHHLVFVLFFSLFLTSCEEDPTSIGTDLLPGKDFLEIKSTDTLSVFAYTVYDESTRTDKPTYSYLGSVYDPYFGITYAEFVTEIRLGSAWNGGEFTVDSIKLFLRLEDVKGDVNSRQVLTISEIADRLYYDSAYYSNTPVNLTGFDAASIELPRLKADTVNNLEINLPLEFGNYLMRDTSMLFHSNSKPDFRSFFNGLYFRITSSTAPLLLTVKLEPPVSTAYSNNYFILYYHDASNITRKYYFILDAVSKNACFNRFSHDFNAAEPDKRIRHLNDGVRDTLTYVQSLNGVSTKFILPGLRNLKENPEFSGVSVNKARIIVPVYLDNDILKNKTVSSQIYLAYKNLKGQLSLVPDYSVNTGFFDGKLDTLSGVYRFNIASFVDKYLKDSGNTFEPELELILPSGGIKNTVLKANNSNIPVKFEFLYTKF